jgi:hypothetical protein
MERFIIPSLPKRLSLYAAWTARPVVEALSEQPRRFKNRVYSWQMGRELPK